MRIDKYLKVSRLVKRRPLAKEILEKKRVSVNGKVVKPGYQVKLGDVIEIKYGNRIVEAKILKIVNSTKKSETQEMYQILKEEKIEKEQLW
jgi:ribosomal 50S subunit-recycling heat shock protein